MKKRNVIRCAVIVILLSSLNLATAADLVTLKAEYDRAKQDLDTARDISVQNSVTAYSNALTTIETQLKKDGNLEGLLAVRKEKERFSASGEIPKSPPADLPQAIVQAQLAHTARTQQADKTRDKNLAIIAKQYLTQLAVLKKQLTSQDKIDDALQVQTEMKVVESSLPPAPTEQVSTSFPSNSEKKPSIKDITTTFSGGTKESSGIVLKNQRTTSKDSYTPPVEIEYVCKTDGTNIRLSYACDQLIFNWERNLDELRINGGPVSRQNRMGAGRVPTNKFITIRQVVNKDKMDVFVEDELRASWQADFSKINSSIGIFSAEGSTVTVKSISIRRTQK